MSSLLPENEFERRALQRTLLGMAVSGRWTMADVRSAVRGTCWFDEGTLDWWGTHQYDESVCPALSQGRVYFVTSEYGPFRDTSTRLFSVRYLDGDTLTIQTLHFQQFTTLAQALRVCRRAAQGLTDTLSEESN